MTQDQLHIRVSALVDTSKELGLTKEDLIACLRFEEIVNKGPAPDTEDRKAVTKWGMKNIEILKKLDSEGVKLQAFYKLRRIARAYQISIKLVDNRVKFGLA